MKINAEESSESENESDEEEEEEEEEGLSDDSANECLKRLEAENKGSQRKLSQDKRRALSRGYRSEPAGKKHNQSGVPMIDLEEQTAEESEPEEKRKKKRRKHRWVISRRAARRCGLKEVGEDEEWTVYWTDCSVSLERVMEMKRFQPFLIDGFKFDMRIYVLVTSCDPLKIFLYEEGLARFATMRYIEPSSSNLDDICMHLTNYAINKHNENFVRDDNTGSKRYCEVRVLERLYLTTA
uniref:Tubulin tyrosine ligase like 13 n=1 Tax=Salvator merianae TaxID=96440 RepID=A0A8D0E965_SALMN